MRIECPQCGTQAQLAGSRSVRVRCGACDTVYRVKGRETAPGGLFWGLGVALVAAVVIVLLARKGDDGKAPDTALASAPEEIDEAPSLPVPGDGWDTPVVAAAVAIHEAAVAGDRAALYGHFDEARLRAAGRFDTIGAAANELLESEDPFAVHRWRGLDGSVLRVSAPGGSPESEPATATVRLACIPADRESLPEDERFAKRWFDWTLVRDPRTHAWRAVAWERFVSPEEIEAERVRNEAVVLTDGSRVIERVAERQEPLPETDPALLQEIEALLEVLLDLDLTRESARAQGRLVDIGKPAIPLLLNELLPYDRALTEQDDAIRVNLIVQTLRRITGRSFGYRPQLLEGSSLGTTEERRDSSLRQWFAWWDMHHDDFEGYPEPDPEPGRGDGRDD